MDEWRVIAARPNYEICRDGRVRRVAAGQGAVAGKFINRLHCADWRSEGPLAAEQISKEPV